MDGYTLTAKLKKMRRRFRLTATEQAIYHELVGICNEDGWEDIFCASNEEICSALSISENTLNTSRQTLINAGLIYYLSGKSKRQVGKYSFKKPFKENKTTTSKNEGDVEVNPEVDHYTNTEVDPEDYNKTKTETKLSPYNPPRGYENFNFDFLDFEFRECLSEWLRYKSTKCQKYKDQKSLEVFYKKMIKHSGGRPDIANLMIEESMSNNWAGLFPLKDTKGGINEAKQTARQPDYSEQM